MHVIRWGIIVCLRPGRRGRQAGPRRSACPSSLGEVGSVTVFRRVPPEFPNEGGSLGSKTDCDSPGPRAKTAPMLHVRFPAQWSVVVQFDRDAG